MPELFADSKVICGGLPKDPSTFEIVGNGFALAKVSPGIGFLRIRRPCGSHYAAEERVFGGNKGALRGLLRSFQFLRRPDRATKRF
jgi:hypothetical protein